MATEQERSELPVGTETREQGHPLLKKVERHIGKRMAAGFLVLIPLAVTYLVLQFLFFNVDDILRPYIEAIMGWAGVLESGEKLPRGVGFGTAIILLYLVGLAVASKIGLRGIDALNSVWARVPVVKSIYGVTKQVTDALSEAPGHHYSRVVFIEWPRPGVKALGFVTGHLSDADGKPLVAVYIPTVPNPTSGMLAIVPEDEIQESGMTVEEAMKTVLSGGVLLPNQSRPAVVKRSEMRNP